MELAYFLFPLVVGVACVAFGFWPTIIIILKFGSIEGDDSAVMKPGKNKQFGGVFVWVTGAVLLVYFIMSVPFGF